MNQHAQETVTNESSSPFKGIVPPKMNILSITHINAFLSSVEQNYCQYIGTLKVKRVKCSLDPTFLKISAPQKIDFLVTCPFKIF